MTAVSIEAVSERVTFLMSPAEKAKLEAKARKARISIGEYLRRAAEAYDPDGQDELEQLAALADALVESNRRAHAAIDHTLANADRILAELKAGRR